MSIQVEETPLHFVNAGSADAPRLHRFSVEQYHEMIAFGILTENDRVQLIDGYIVAMNPIGVSHRYVVHKTAKLLASVLPTGWDVYVQQPLTLPTSEPEPDIAVVRGGPDDFKDRHPGAKDVALVVEVADTSLKFDRESKGHSYAAAGIREYWIVNLVGRQVEVFRLASPDMPDAPAKYANRELLDVTGALNVVLDGQTVATIRVADILP